MKEIKPRNNKKGLIWGYYILFSAVRNQMDKKGIVILLLIIPVHLRINRLALFFYREL